MPSSYKSVKAKVEKMPDVTTRPMFGYQCYSINKKFFVGFSNKNEYQIIVRLPKVIQEKAIKNKGISPFSHGARMGWIEINSKDILTSNAFKWITKGYDHALQISKKSIS